MSIAEQNERELTVKNWRIACLEAENAIQKRLIDRLYKRINALKIKVEKQLTNKK